MILPYRNTNIVLIRTAIRTHVTRSLEFRLGPLDIIPRKALKMGIGKRFSLDLRDGYRYVPRNVSSQTPASVIGNKLFANAYFIAHRKRPTGAYECSTYFVHSRGKYDTKG